MPVKEWPALMAGRSSGNGHAEIPIHHPHRGSWVWPVLDRNTFAFFQAVDTAMGPTGVGLAFRSRYRPPSPVSDNETPGLMEGRDSGSTLAETHINPPNRGSWVR